MAVLRQDGPITDWECLCGKYKRIDCRVAASARERGCGASASSGRRTSGFFTLPAPTRLRDLECILYFES